MRLLLAAAFLVCGTVAGHAQDAGADIGALLAKADATKGQTSAKKCAACHDFTKGGPNKIGPNLWGVVGRPVASVANFAYSDGMKKFGEGGKTWSFEELDKYLANPKADVPGNKMAFPGLKKDDERANVIAYLNTLSDSPQPLPAAQ